MTVEFETEAGFQRTVTEYATWRGWRWYHTHDSRRSPSGFPDLVLVRGQNLIFVELKSEKGRVTSDQQEWIDALSATNYDHSGPLVFVWRPSDWESIERELR